MNEFEEYYEPTLKPGETNVAWMLSFADLLSILTTFFIMLFSMCEVKTGHWEEASESLHESLNPKKIIAEIVKPREAPSTYRSVKKSAASLDYLQRVIEAKLDDDVKKNIVIRKLDDRLVISFASDLLFKKGSAELDRQGLTTLGAVSDVVGNLNNKIDVNGHTDPNAISTGDIASNWELSLMRARELSNRIYASGYTGVIDVYGFADSRFDEIDPTLPTQTRQKLARRVDVVIRTMLP